MMGRTLPALRSLILDRWRLLNTAAIGLLAVYVLAQAAQGHHGDAWAYYTADLTYADARVGVVSYVYPPLLAQALAPLRLLPFEVFYGLMLGGEVAALAWFVTPLGALALIAAGIPNLADELVNGNINLILGAALVAGFRWPALWAGIGLTKITAIGPGLVWFAVRREWRNLLVAGWLTVVVALLSVVLSPQAWVDWLAYVQRDYGQAPLAFLTPLPLRLALAAGITVLAAQRGIRWPLPIAMVIAMPVPGTIHWTAALAAIPLLRAQQRDLEGARPGPGRFPEVQSRTRVVADQGLEIVRGDEAEDGTHLQAGRERGVPIR